MADMRSIVSFSYREEKLLGVLIEHYSNPLDDFYVAYADYTLYKFHSSDEDATVIIDNVIIPACDEALSDYKLRTQHLKDMGMLHREIQSLVKAFSAKSGDVDTIFGNDEN